MTSVNVFNLSSVKQGPTVNANTATGRTKAGSTHDVSVFASLMNSNYSTGYKYSPDDVKGSAGVQTAKDSFDWSKSHGKEIQAADTVTVADKISGSEDTLEDFEEGVINVVAEELGISEESVKEALEILGLTAFDLMNPQNVVQLAMQLTDENSPATLLTNPQFLDLMQGVGEISGQLMEDLGLAPEQMEELVAQMDFIQESQQVIADEYAEPAAETKEITVAAGQQKEVVVTVSQEEAVQEENVPEVRQAEQPAGQNEAFGQQNMQEEESGTKGNSQPAAKRTEPVQANHTAPLVQTVSEMDIPVTQPLAEDSYLSIDTMDIIEQIAENVKVNLSQAETSLEMQLNPENLGKIYLQISAKQGAVSAQIAASNEAVKVALEAQVADLRESLNQAGVKVDAIEVTVASHEFEKNLEQNFTREQQEGERQQEQASHRRNINLSELDELSSVMTEEEALVAQIMRDNGNSVDLTA